MKSTLLFICSLLCLCFFSWQLVLTGSSLGTPPEDAWQQVVDAREAAHLVEAQQACNAGFGMLNLIFAGAAAVVAVGCLFVLRRQRVLHWLRAGLLLANIIILLACVALFGLTLMETLQPTPQCMQLRWPWQESYWAQALQHTQQAAMFLGLCCGMLSGVNCAAFYLFHRRREQYGD